MSFSYDPTKIMTTPLYQVRRLIADVLSNEQQLQDEEIAWELSQRGSNVYAAAGECCELIAAKYSRDVDVVQGELRTLYSVRQKAYAARAIVLKRTAKITGPGMPYAGAISVADKMRQEADGDRVQPQFNIGMFDNWHPVPPVGNETQNYTAPFPGSS